MRYITYITSTRWRRIGYVTWNESKKPFWADCRTSLSSLLAVKSTWCAMPGAIVVRGLSEFRVPVHYFSLVKSWSETHCRPRATISVIADEAVDSTPARGERRWHALAPGLPPVLSSSMTASINLSPVKIHSWILHFSFLAIVSRQIWKLKDISIVSLFQSLLRASNF